MKFLSIYKPGKEITGGPCDDEIKAMGGLIDEMTKAGVLLATEGCMPSSAGARVSIDKGEFMVTDGPFPETKELIAGFCMFQVKTKAEAVEWGKRFLAVVGDGRVEIMQIFEWQPQ